MEQQEAIPDKLVEVNRTGHDPFIQTDALLQRAGMLSSEVHAVWALHVISAIFETGIVSAMAPGLEIGRGHHLLFHLAQRCIPHEVACHKVILIPSCLILQPSSLISSFSSISLFWPGIRHSPG